MNLRGPITLNYYKMETLANFLGTGFILWCIAGIIIGLGIVFYNGRELWSIYCKLAYYSHFILPSNLYYWTARPGEDPRKEI